MLGTPLHSFFSKGNFIIYKYIERMCSTMNSEIQTLIASVGFPIALSMYLLVRIEGKLQALSDSINELSKNIISMK